ncbi:ribonuclease Z [Saccharomonospora iraqiensis]|uniref:ribonuclease Z n=1 Tax=Saccharomonospora iraqiensis TaxID=52698 RepID=UPI00022E7C2F|nr:ribonuclease Z [Saccharomonospora iraqiensis]
MTARELVVLGTGSQVPSRDRAQNGYLLRWDDEGILFDPGEGTQRQMTFAGVSVRAVTRMCLTHFHGDHCLGVPGIVQRMSLDGLPSAVAHYPATGARYFDRLRHASVFHATTELTEHPVERDGRIASGPFGELRARRLDHPVEAFGYQLVEPDRVHLVPDLLERHGVRGPDVGRLRRTGTVDVGGRTVTVNEVSVTRPGQRFGFVMDTRLCENAFALAEDADLLTIESTFLSSEADLARRYGHLTAAEAGRVAAESRVRTLVLTHFSQRYTKPSHTEPTRFHDEAAEVFGGDIVVARDVSRIPVPRRVRPE